MLRTQTVNVCFSSCMVVKLGRSVPIMICKASVCWDVHLNALNNLNLVWTPILMCTAGVCLEMHLIAVDDLNSVWTAAMVEVLDFKVCVPSTSG